MWNIKNDHELRQVYELIRTMEAMQDNNHLQNLIIEFKRMVRKYTHTPVSESRIVKEYGIDGVDVIVPLDISPDAEESEAVEYFEDNLYIYSPESAYDCTGRAFTSWFRVFKRQSKWYAYHAIRYDV